MTRATISHRLKPTAGVDVNAERLEVARSGFGGNADLVGQDGDLGIYRVGVRLYNEMEDVLSSARA